VRIFYPFNPRAGQIVQVEHRKRFAGEDHLVIVQPDGTLALIPSWMSEETARSTAITGSPCLSVCLSVDRLVELRVGLDALLASSDGEPSRLSWQQDLFEVDQKMWDIPNTQKPLLISLIERMLVEALADDGVTTHAASEKAREVADEQDHV
jgi:hypothetical protein